MIDQDQRVGQLRQVTSTIEDLTDQRINSSLEEFPPYWINRLVACRGVGVIRTGNFFDLQLGRLENLPYPQLALGIYSRVAQTREVYERLERDAEIPDNYLFLINPAIEKEPFFRMANTCLAILEGVNSRPPSFSVDSFAKVVEHSCEQLFMHEPPFKKFLLDMEQTLRKDLLTQLNIMTNG